jgi:DNA-binding transcriptional ArsR family regulator
MLDRTFAALAHPARRAIVAQLVDGQPLAVGEIARTFPMTLPAVIKHLDILTDAGFVTRTRVGRNVHCRLTPEPMGEAVDWLARHLKFWNTRLDALEALMEAKRHD